MTTSPEQTTPIAATPDNSTDTLNYSKSPLNSLATTHLSALAPLTLTSLRGGRAGALSSPTTSQSTLTSPSHDNPEINQQLTVLWTATHGAGGSANLGADIKTLLPLLEKNPSLLKQLSDVATATSLFGINQSDPNITPEKFNQMKSDFLRAIISKAAHFDEIKSGQGETSTCCAAAALNGKFLTQTQYLELSCGLALNSSCTLAGNVTVNRDSDLRAAERVSGMPLFSDSSLAKPRSLQSVSNPLPTFGEAIVNASLIKAFGGSVDDGMQAEQYTRMLGAMSGKELACVDGQGWLKGNHSFQNFNSPLDYIDRFLGDNPERGVPVDLKWCDADKTSGTQRHGRHLLSVVGSVSRDDGEYLVLLNPIGDSVYTDSSGKEVFYPPGHELGDRSKGIWWLVGDKPGEVLVKRDVFEQNLQTVLAETGESFDKNKAPILIGIPEEQEIEWIKPLGRSAGTQVVVSLSELPKGGAEVPQAELAGEAIAKWMEAMADKRAKEALSAAQGNSVKIPNPLGVIAAYDVDSQMYEASPPKARNASKEDGGGFFTSNQQSGSRAGPPPPPPGSPGTKAA